MARLGRSRAAEVRQSAVQVFAEVRLLNGDVFVVEGELAEVEGKLSDASRSGQSRLAWFTESGTGAPVGVNPTHVASLRVSEVSD